jgi:hypothetical protein
LAKSELSVMSPKSKRDNPPRVRVSAVVVMDVDSLARAKAKAREHEMPFPVFLEQAVRLYGKYLDKKVGVFARPI